ncbi:MAG: hypothetical protein U0W24_26065 [Bacteroidales bacterium]
MPRKILISLIFTFTIRAFSQNTLEIETGINVTNDLTEGFGSLENYALGPRVGVNYLHSFTKWFDLETGLCYMQKTDKEKYNPDSAGRFTSKNFYRYNYIELPLNLKFNINKWSVYTGAYIAYTTGIYKVQKMTERDLATNKIIWKEKIRTEKGSFTGVDLEFFDSEWKNDLDYGIHLGFGYIFNRIRLKFGAEYSLAEDKTSNYFDPSLDYKSFKALSGYLSVAYQFHPSDKNYTGKTDSLFNSRKGFLIGFELSDLNGTNISTVFGVKENKIIYFAGYERFYYSYPESKANRIKAGIYIYPHRNLGNFKLFYQTFLSNKWYDSEYYPKSTLLHAGLGFDYFIFKNLSMGLQGNLGYGREKSSSTVSGPVFDYQAAFSIKIFYLKMKQ